MRYKHTHKKQTATRCGDEEMRQKWQQKKEMFEQPQMLVNKRYFETVMETERVPSSVER